MVSGWWIHNCASWKTTVGIGSFMFGQNEIAWVSFKSIEMRTLVACRTTARWQGTLSSRFNSSVYRGNVGLECTCRVNSGLRKKVHGKGEVSWACSWWRYCSRKYACVLHFTQVLSWCLQSQISTARNAAGAHYHGSETVWRTHIEMPSTDLGWHIGHSCFQRAAAPRCH